MKSGKFLIIPQVLIPLVLILMTGCFNRQAGGGEGFTTTINEQQDVIVHLRSVKNVEKLDAFADAGEGRQRIVHYTTEGDPIFSDLQYIGSSLELREDTTEDKFGAPTVTRYTCAALARNETDTTLNYTLKGCTGERPEIEILQLDFDVDRQDVFWRINN